MAWLAVDKNGTEKVFQNEPDRNTNYWYINRDSVFAYNSYVFLPKGSIEKLIGRTLTWEDDPVEIV